MANEQDPEILQSMNEQMELLNAQEERRQRLLERSARISEEIVDTTTSYSERALGGAEKVWAKINVDLRRAQQSLKNLAVATARGGDAFKQAYSKPLDKAVEQSKRLAANLKEHYRSIEAGLDPGKLGRGMDRGAGKLTSAVQGGDFKSMVSTATQGLPGGGLIALMMFGQYEQAEHVARAQRVMQQFRQVGDSGQQYVSQVSSRIRKLSVQLGKDVSAEFQKVTQSMANIGVGPEEAFQQSQVAIDGVKRSLVETTFALDRFTNGAATPAITNFMQNANMNMRESVTLVSDLAMAAGEMGMSFTMASGAIGQATSALRRQGTSAADLAEILQDIQAGYMETGNMTAQQAGARATEGLSAIGAGLGNMDQGMLGFFGKRMYDKQGEDISAFGASVRLERGLAGGADSKDMVNLLGEITTYMQERFPNDPDRQYRVAKMIMKENKAAGNALASMISESEESGKSIKDVGKINQKQLKALLKNEAKQVNEFDRLGKRIRDAVARLGSSIVEVLMGGFAQVAAIVELLRGWSMTGPSDEALERAQSLSNIGVNATQSGVAGIVKFAKTAANLTKDSGVAFGGGHAKQLMAAMRQNDRGRDHEETQEQFAEGSARQRALIADRRRRGLNFAGKPIRKIVSTSADIGNDLEVVSETRTTVRKKRGPTVERGD